MSILDLKSKLEKASGVHVATLAESNIAKHEINLPTPALDLNRVISGSFFKGIPDKTLTLIVGPEHSFKSSFAMLCCGIAQQKGFTPIIIDTEGGITNEFAERWGVDPESSLLVYTPIVSKIEIILGELLESNDENFIIILDSIGGIFRQKVLEDMKASSKGKRDAPKQDQGSLQKDLKRMLKLLTYVIKMKNSIGIMSGHFYGDPNSYGSAEQIGGGKYIKLAPDIIISLKKQNLYENPDAPARDRIIRGTQIKAIPLKNRFYPPFQEALIEIDYKNGINELAGILDFAIKAKIIEKKGAWFTYNDERVQGSKNIEKVLKENKDEILEELNEWLKQTGYSTINKEVENIYKENLIEKENE